MTMQPEVSDVIVVGGGAIGAATAWRCAQRGLKVVVVDPGTDTGAWRAAAGMLAPLSELYYGETALLRLGRDSLARFPAFVEELSECTGLATGFRRCGTITVAWDHADLANLVALGGFAEQLGLTASTVSGRALRALEPALASGLAGGIVSGDDHQVDPRLLHRALIEAGALAGVQRVTGTARVETRGDRATGVLLDNGRTLSAASIVLAAGAWTGRIEGVPRDVLPAVRPVKGHTLRLMLPGEPRLTHVVRGIVRGSAVYIVPRADGRLVVGASSEEAGFDRSVRAGAVYETLRDAQTIFPELAEAVLEETVVGLRPGTPDNVPLIGRSRVDGLFFATGHFRNGILLSPLTADAIADVLTTGSMPDGLGACVTSRFEKEAVA